MALGEAQQRLLAALRAGGRSPGVPAVPTGSGPVVTELQRRLWLFDQLHPGTAVHHLAAAWQIDGPLDVERLRAAVTRMVEVHEVLRTTLSADPNPTATVLPAQAVRLDLQEAPGADDAELQRRTDAVVAARFEAGGPLVRAAVVRTSPERARLVLVAHHCVFDGGSLAPAWATLTTAYAGA
ncbi:MAG: condensation domain-containing protein, partial [Myxococcota bacterium]